MRISASVIDRHAAALQRTDIGAVVHRTALKTAPRVRTALRASARAAGASRGMQQAVDVHDGHSNDLVMHQPTHHSDVLVGVDGASPYANEAEAMEHGYQDVSGTAENATFWVASSVLAHGRAWAGQWSDHLTTELQRTWR